MGEVTTPQTAGPTRPIPAAFPVLIDETPRYSDLDSSRRIGRDALVRWFEDARVAVEYRSFGADITSRERSQIRVLLASVQVDVHAPLTVAGSYRVGVGITHVGTSSFTYTYAVFAGAECVATGTSVSVHVGDGGGSAPLPDALRRSLESLRLATDVTATRPVRDPGLLVRENYPFRLDVRTRFTDVDTNRHVNNVALARWYLDGLAELHLDVLGYPTGGPLDGLSPSSLRVDYLAEVHYPGIYQLRVGVAAIDENTVRYLCGLFDGPRCVGLAEAVGAHRIEGVGLADSLAPWAMRG